MAELGFKTTTVSEWKNNLATGHSETWLKTLIVLWAIGVIILVIFFVHNKWILAGIFLYEVLP